MDQAALGAVESAFTWLAEGKVAMPPIMHIEVAENNGDVDIKFSGEVSARFDIETFNGRIRNCFGPEPVRTSEYAPGRELRFTEGGGEGRVVIRTLNGGLRLCTE